MAELTTHTRANGLLDEDDLKDWLKVRSRARLIKWLDAQDLPYRLSPQGRIVTEAGAISRALSSVNSSSWDNLEFGDARA